MKGKRRRAVSSSSSSDDEVPEAPKRSQAASKSTQNNSNTRAGRILQMTLKNFMCHSFLEVEFAGNVNFLTGNNGSGKSAILAALSLGLGCKAKSTNRGDISSIKAFIKFGCNSASIEIVLNNQGPQAYKPEEYGAKIVVCRTMALSGGSTYRIKNEQGRIVTKKLKDLAEITTALNIQVDNPVCILSQDTARNFLNATDNKKRFDLFFRATRLDQLHQMFDEAVRRKNLAVKEFNLKKLQECELKKKTHKLDKQITEARKLEELKLQFEALNNEKAWGTTLLNERKYKKQKRVVDALEEELQTLEENCEKHKEIVEKATHERVELEAKLRELNQAQDENEKPVQELTLQIRAVEKQITEKNTTIASAERQLTFRKQDLEGLQAMINNFNNRCNQIEQEKQAKQEKLEQLGVQGKEKNNLLTTYEDEYNKLSMHCKEKESKMESIKQELYASTNKINILTDKLNTLQRDTNNPYAIYGPNYVRLMTAIEAEEQNFSRPPIGPIGSHVSIRDKKWTLAVESYLKSGLLCSFLVNSQQDQNRLNQIIKRVWPREGGGRPPSIIATKFFDKVYDVSKNLVESYPNCVRMFDVLSVQNANVMNLLIDQASIESVLLIPDKKVGFSIMKNRNTVPHNCRISITPAGDTIYPDPNYKIYCGRQTMTKFIQVDTAFAVKQCEMQLAKENQTKAMLRKNLETAREDVAAASEGLPRIKQHIAQCRQDLEVVTRKIYQVQTLVIEVPGNVDDLKKELTELDKIIKQKSSTVHESRLELEELQSKVDDLRAEIHQFDSARRESRKNKEELQDLINTQLYKSQAVTKEYNKIKRQFEELKNSIANEKEIMEKLQKYWEELYVETEAKNGPRPENIRRSEEIDEDINGIRAKMQDLARFNLRNLEEDLRRLLERIDVHRETMRDLEVTLVELQDAKAGRKTKLLETKKYMKDYAIFNFTNFLRCRNYQGNMAINYDNETLDMVVIPHAGARGVTPTTNLSGGERSFSTVAFLYALWKTLDFPFYILDEFDVYMDPQNRNLVIQILIDHAKKNKEVQYVFLTPQDISFIKDPDVAIHRLEDPERIRAK